MPGELIEVVANADGIAASFLGFWRFLGSSSYRTTVRARWAARTGAARWRTVAEVAASIFLGLLLPALAVYLGVLQLSR